MTKRREYTWDDGKKLTLDEGALVMGILNGTPDSFSDGGKYNTPAAAVAHTKEMIAAGAHVIDFGVESSRPGYQPMPVDDEIERMKALLPGVLEAASVPVSIDTYRAKSADYALSQGAHILNDIWGLQYDPEIAAVAASYKVPVILMHNQHEEKYGDIIEDLKAFFDKSITIADKAGVLAEHIWLDPGIGFAKNGQQNIEIIRRLEELTCLPYPLLLAPSRKRFIGELLDGIPAPARDEGTGAVITMGIIKGADMVRVHNVKMIAPMVKVVNGLIGGR